MSCLALRRKGAGVCTHLYHSKDVRLTSHSYPALPPKDLRSWKETLLLRISENLCRRRTPRLPASMTAAATLKAVSLLERCTTKTKEFLENFIDTIPQSEVVK